ncbi:hypothetical protein vseg_019293 [Gypsophila vaccaria]
MSTLHHLTLLLFLLPLSTATTTTPPPPPSLIQRACNATRFPTPCKTSLTSFSSPDRHQNPVQIIRTTLSLSSAHLKTALTLSSTILATFPNHLNRSRASRACLDHLTLSLYRTRRASRSLSSRATLLDSRAWASAALTYQYDCWNELSYVNGTRVVDTAMAFISSTLMVAASNAVSMLHALVNFGEDPSAWTGPPQTERQGFWEKTILPSGKRPRLDRPRDGNVDAVVCKEGKARGCHASVMEAVKAAPAWLKGRGKFVIYIKAGVYEEIVRVPLEKRNLVFLGDGKGKTVISGSVNTGVMGITTYNTATVGVQGDGFMARDITFQNTAGPNAHQAVAFRSDSDFSLLENCEFLGNQDTLYAHSLRQLYRSCHIEGNVDFIFGNAAALFQDCTILVRPRLVDPAKGENNAVTASGRIDPAQPTGLVFVGCHISGTDEYMKLWRDNPNVHRNYLGRPWKMYSRTVFIDSTMGPIISPEGWMPFRDDFALSTLYYGEFGNQGPGSDRSKRVNWSSLIPQGHVNAYSAQNFIQSNEWM